MNDTVLEIKNLSKSFAKNTVLNGINFSVKKGSVMGLMGENGAGKSTMMKCLFGIYAKDEGQISLLGKPIDFKSPKEALENGIAMVHQELNQCLDRTVTDNLFLGRYPKKFGVIDEAKMERESNKLFSSLNMNINCRTIMRTMSVSQRQMVEIAKAVSYDAKLIVLDEPTSSLTENEIKKLFSIVNDLKSKVVTSINGAIKTIDRPGWVRADKIEDGNIMEEKVRKIFNSELEKRTAKDEEVDAMLSKIFDKK